jgi:hypothetical protein
MTTLSEEVPKKACRTRPEKNMQAKTSAAEPSELNAFIPASSSSAHATQADPLITVTEFGIAIEALPRNVRASTAMIYRMLLEHWKVFFISSSFGQHINHMNFSNIILINELL